MDVVNSKKNKKQYLMSLSMDKLKTIWNDTSDSDVAKQDIVECILEAEHNEKVVSQNNLFVQEYGQDGIIQNIGNLYGAIAYCRLPTMVNIEERTREARRKVVNWFEMHFYNGKINKTLGHLKAQFTEDSKQHKMILGMIEAVHTSLQQEKSKLNKQEDDALTEDLSDIMRQREAVCKKLKQVDCTTLQEYLSDWYQGPTELMVAAIVYNVNIHVTISNDQVTRYSPTSTVQDTIYICQRDDNQYDSLLPLNTKTAQTSIVPQGTIQSTAVPTINTREGMTVTPTVSHQQTMTSLLLGDQSSLSTSSVCNSFTRHISTSGDRMMIDTESNVSAHE
jgi:hypothetical protein